MGTRSRSRRAVIEKIESRMLLSAAVSGTPLVVNATKLPNPQAEEAIAVNPTNPNQLFLVTNDSPTTISEGSTSFNGLFTARSNDGGHTWSPLVIGTGTDGFPAGCCDGSVAWDNFGNLYFSYLTNNTMKIEVLLSADAGQTFHELATIPGAVDQPTITVGPGSVWVTSQKEPKAGSKGAVIGSGAAAYGAQVTGLARVGAFKRAEEVSKPTAEVGDIAVGPGGQVTTVSQFNGTTGPTALYTRSDPDGLGPKPFGPINGSVMTNIGFFYAIPAQAVRTIDAESSLAYDRSGDAYAGRLYLVYTDSPSPGSADGTVPPSADTNIFLRFSDDDGAHWSGPVRVNDDSTTNSQFFPKVAVDPVTGAVGISWYDARNDTGVPGTGGTNNTPNDDVQVYGAVGTPTATGVNFSPNFVIQPGFSNSSDMIEPFFGPDPNQYGDYNGLTFYNGVMYPSWADNSNSTGDNGNGTHSLPDAYVGIVNVSVTPAPTRTLVGEFGDVGKTLKVTLPGGTQAVLSLRRGRGYAFIDGNKLDLRIVPDDAKASLRISARGGTRRIALGNVAIQGSLKSLDAPNADLSGSLSASGTLGSVTLGSMTGAQVLSGAEPGGDAVFSGAADTDDTFTGGSIDSLLVRGDIVNSFVGAGVNPVDGVFGNGNDQIIGGSNSRIKRLRARSADAASRFAAGSFGSVALPAAINPASDARFQVG